MRGAMKVDHGCRLDCLALVLGFLVVAGGATAGLVIWL